MERRVAAPADVPRGTAGGALSAAPGARDLLEQGLGELGHPPPHATIERLWALVELLDRWAPRIQLTGHRSREAIVGRLVLDAAALERVLPSGEDLVDLGSGAGFPGLPLAILRPGRAVRLVESRERRIHFQRAAIRALGLDAVSSLHGRAEDLEPQPGAIAVAQAVSSPSLALHLMLRWARPGGWLAVPGGEVAPRIEAPDEIVESRVVGYRVPCGGPERTLWLGRLGS